MDESVWWKSVEEASTLGQKITGSGHELNLACEHIVQLLKDASLLLEAGSHASAAFLAITALEETAKIHIDIYRRSSESVRRKIDPMFNHGKKHRIAAAPTVVMGSRLQKSIGEQRMQELINLAQDGHFVSIRERALYVERRGGLLRLPSNAITKSLARELLLFAIEAFDDAFVGCTNYSFELSKTTDLIFMKWENA
jgi:AbiV family abortive infection protein